MADEQLLKDVAERLRVLSIKSTNASNSGHPTTCASIAEVMSVLFFDEMRQSLAQPRGASNDRLVLSKGHAAPILYAAWAVAGLFPEEKLMDLRKIDCDLEGHPTPRLNFVDVATGSLGQGLSVAAGMAYTAKHFDKMDYRVYCILGDGEVAEGSVWEAMNFAQNYNLDNLVAIFDINRLGQSEPTCLQHQMDTYKARCEAFGFHTIVVDGHCVKALKAAFAEARSVKNKPTALVLKTFKGRGFPGIEDMENWHGKPLGDKADAVIAAIEARMQDKHPINVPMKAPEAAAAANIDGICLSEPPAYQLGEKVATRLAYGTAIAKLGASSKRVVALDADTKNSTYSDKFKKAHPDRFVECFIAEQNLIGVAIGCGTRQRTVPFVSTFAAFFTRAFDQLRMGAISQANIKCAGSHAGISIGEDGPSQMALEDIAMFRTIPDSLVLYPSDAVSTERACELAANYRGIVFIRTSRPATAVLYSSDEPFKAGGAKIVKQSSSDKALVIGAGVTLHEALAAAKELSAADGINIRVMDIFSVKPIDSEAILQNAAECGNNVIVVEDHYQSGGIGDAVSHVLATGGKQQFKFRHLCVGALPRSGPPAVLLDMFGISSKCIAKAVREL